MRGLFISTTLVACAVTVVSLAQPHVSIARYAGDKSAAVSYTFDDGLLEHYTKVFPELNKRNMKASFCIIGSKVGKDQKRTPCMTWKQIKEMSDAGQEMTNHGWGHKAVSKLDAAALRYEVQHNDTVLFNHTGVFPRTYFFPGNRETPEALAFCSKDRVGVRTEQVSIGSKRTEAWLKRWIDGLIAVGKWGVGMTHGITIGYDAFSDPHVLWKHFDYVCGLRDKLWIDTFHNVSAYVKERDAVTLDVENHKSFVTVVLDNPLDKRIFNYPLTLIIQSTRVKGVDQDGRRLPLSHKGQTTLVDIDPNGGKILIRLK